MMIFTTQTPDDAQVSWNQICSDLECSTEANMPQPLSNSEPIPFKRS